MNNVNTHKQKTKKERITAIQFNDDKTKTTNTEKQASDNQEIVSHWKPWSANEHKKLKKKKRKRDPNKIDLIVKIYPTNQHHI